MAESRVFKLMNGVTLEMLGEAVEGFLRDSKGMQTQAGQTTGGYLIQGRQEADGWKIWHMVIMTDFKTPVGKNWASVNRAPLAAWNTYLWK